VDSQAEGFSLSPANPANRPGHDADDVNDKRRCRMLRAGTWLLEAGNKRRWVELGTIGGQFRIADKTGR
jgi:hypothetical protein